MIRTQAVHFDMYVSYALFGQALTRVRAVAAAAVVVLNSTAADAVHVASAMDDRGCRSGLGSRSNMEVEGGS